MSLDRGLGLAGQLNLTMKGRDTARIIAVGDPDQWLRTGNSLPRGEHMRFVSFAEITRDLLEDCAPEIILSPVVAHQFDCIDLAERLCRLGYDRPYRAISDDLPSPEIIEREIRQICPRLDFAVIMAQ